MKTCYMCKGPLELSLIDVEVRGVIVKDTPAEVCKRCGEKYFDTRTASFIQDITRCIDDKKRGFFADVVRSAHEIESEA